MSSSSLEDLSKKLSVERDPAHDFTHVERIIKLCRPIAPLETDIDLLIESAYFHGLLREEANIRNSLKSLGFDDSHIERIIKTVRNARSVAEPGTNEEKVLHDANILDALGAIGIARAFTKGGYEHQTIDETVKIMKKNMERELYTPKAKEIGQQRKRFMKRFLKQLVDDLQNVAFRG